MEKKATWKNFYLKNLKNSMADHAGRTDIGHISVRHRFRGAKKLVRQVDFRRYLLGEEARILHIEKDPIRTALVGLIFFKKFGLFSYILLASGLGVGMKIGTTLNFPDPQNRRLFVGWSFSLGFIPLSVPIFNIEIKPNFGGTVARSAGVCGDVARKFPSWHGSYNFVGVHAPSGKHIFSFRDCLASLGRVSNRKHYSHEGLLASYSYYKGYRPSVRGVAMNPVDHPHGGGEGKTSGGRPSVSKWGRPTKGYTTRSRRKSLREKKLLKRRSRK